MELYYQNKGVNNSSGKSKEKQRKAAQKILLSSTIQESLNLLLLKPEEGKTCIAFRYNNFTRRGHELYPINILTMEKCPREKNL